MEIKLLSLLFIIAGISGRCFVQQISNFYSGDSSYSRLEDNDENEQQISMQVCSGLKESCCPNRMMRFINNRFKVHKDNFDHARDFLNLFSVIYDKDRKENPLSALKADQIPENCLSENTKFSFFEKFDIKLLDKAFKKSEQLIGDYICQMCSVNMVSWFGNSNEISETYVSMKQNTKNLKRYSEVVKELLPIITYFENKINHVQAIKCSQGKDYSYISITKTVDGILEELDNEKDFSEKNKTLHDNFEAVISLAFIPEGIKIETIFNLLVLDLLKDLHELSGDQEEFKNNLDLQPIFPGDKSTGKDVNRYKVELVSNGGLDLSETTMKIDELKKFDKQEII